MHFRTPTGGVWGQAMIRVVLVDDHLGLQEDLKRFLERRGTIDVIAIAPEGYSGVRRALELRPDVVTLDARTQINKSRIRLQHSPCFAKGMNHALLGYSSKRP